MEKEPIGEISVKDTLTDRLARLNGVEIIYLHIGEINYATEVILKCNNIYTMHVIISAFNIPNSELWHLDIQPNEPCGTFQVRFMSNRYVYLTSDILNIYKELISGIDKHTNTIPKTDPTLSLL